MFELHEGDKIIDMYINHGDQEPIIIVSSDTENDASDSPSGGDETCGSATASNYILS